jgi:NADH-quinone oxidoreductase subunit C
MSAPPESPKLVLSAAVQAALGDHATAIIDALGELTVEVGAANWESAALACRDAQGLKFDTAIDLCGVDYEGWGNAGPVGRRFAVVLHLLSTQLNQRLRLRVFCPDDDMPLVSSLTVSGRRSAGTSVKPLICTGSFLKAIPTCGVS